ncbi:hypothetical protein ACIBBG_33175 [Micromonospora chersina]|uniref:hypothetical protein n=1 Tax=Micromonospora chersina TaxID=47854 RepID=UPI00379C0271
MATAQQPSATATGEPAKASPSAAAGNSNYDKALGYTRCMTGNGVKMPDPVEGKPLWLGNANNPVVFMPDEKTGWIQISAEVFKKCEPFLPDSWPVKADTAVLAKERPFRQCMRNQGIDLPEPVVDANGMVREPTDYSANATSELQAGVAACRHLVDDPAVKAGQ